MNRKPWSISTAVRNPHRVYDFLKTLKEMEGMLWNKGAHEEYQSLLIRDRLYGYESEVFYSTLSSEHITLIKDSNTQISKEQAREIFKSKNYTDPSMRGRNSFSPLKKLGLATISENKVVITSLGNSLLEKKLDIGEVLIKGFISWQYPGLIKETNAKWSQNIKPFIGVLQLINKVNQLEKNRGNKGKGINRREFALFAQCLVHYNSINEYAEKIITLRDLLKGKTRDEQNEFFYDYREKFLEKFFDTEDSEKIEKECKNLKDYADNSIRYFRLTSLIILNDSGTYVNLEHRRNIELQKLFLTDNGSSVLFDSKDSYDKYIASSNLLDLPWETIDILEKSYKKLTSDISVLEKKQTLKIGNKLLEEPKTKDQLKKAIRALRLRRNELQSREDYEASQGSEQLLKYINCLENIFEYDNRPILLEHMTTLSLNALNDTIQIKPNYPVGDDNMPTFTAPGGVPDIECYYNTFNSICEVTMLKDRSQWFNEGQPVMRHLRDFEVKNKGKDNYCLFIAPRLHRDTVNTFWSSVKYEYEGSSQKIVPLQINQFVTILKLQLFLKNNEMSLCHSQLKDLFDQIILSSNSNKNSSNWVKNISSILNSWDTSIRAVK